MNAYWKTMEKKTEVSFTKLFFGFLTLTLQEVNLIHPNLKYYFKIEE